ncbi:MAG TPA: hypothetical protein VF893_06195 [Candidatus Bathyarchaeia archaeon]
MTDKQGLSFNAPNLEAAKILGDIPKIIFDTKTLDPKGLTYVGTILLGNTRTISIHGQWSPGPTRPYWGPEGDLSTIFNGAPKWSAVTLVLTQDYQIVGGAYGPGPFKITNTSDSMGWIVCVKMNDIYYPDNYNHPTDPMTAEWSL